MAFWLKARCLLSLSSTHNDSRIEFLGAAWISSANRRFWGLGRWQEGRMGRLVHHDYQGKGNACDREPLLSSVTGA